MNQQNHSALAHTVYTGNGVDYEKEVDRASGRKRYIPIVIDDAGGRHRLEQLPCFKAETALTIAKAAREEVLAKLAEDAKVEAEKKQADVDAAMMAAVGA